MFLCVPVFYLWNRWWSLILKFLFGKILEDALKLSVGRFLVQLLPITEISPKTIFPLFAWHLPTFAQHFQRRLIPKLGIFNYLRFLPFIHSHFSTNIYPVALLPGAIVGTTGTTAKRLDKNHALKTDSNLNQKIVMLDPDKAMEKYLTVSEVGSGILFEIVWSGKAH